MIKKEKNQKPNNNKTPNAKEKTNRPLKQPDLIWSDLPCITVHSTWPVSKTSHTEPNTLWLNDDVVDHPKEFTLTLKDSVLLSLDSCWCT